MSGTSIDGIDAGLVDFSDGKISLVDFYYQPFSVDVRKRIHAISQANHPILLAEYGHLDSLIGQLFAEAALELLKKAKIPADQIKAIGSHGQTVYHDPMTEQGFSLQIGDPNRIAEITQITTIADFRRRDIAVGGQGAPLVPAFHQAAFAQIDTPVTVINVGGIANITILDGDNVLGFDTGPGNTLMDLWCQQHLHQAYDEHGAWAASGQVNLDLVKTLSDDPYFRLLPPKSTGKEYFSLDWLRQKLTRFATIKTEDIQASLCQLTANSICDAIKRHAPNTRDSLVCGGGAHNRYLVELMRQQLSGNLLSTADRGIDPDHVEAIAFAWLARQTMNGLPGNLCSVTGAKAPVILGGIYPGGRVLSGK